MKRKFTAIPNVPVPRNSRQVGALVDGTNLRVVSDLIPTQAITEGFPLLGDTLDSIEWAEAPTDDPFGDYVLFKMEAQNGFFTRLYFWKNRSDQLTEPVKSYYTNKAVEWDAILEGIAWLEDSQAVGSVILEDKSIRNYNKVYPRVAYRPSYFGDTLIYVEMFMSSVSWQPEDLVHHQPQSDAVMWNVRDSEGNFQRCLHPEIIIPPEAGSFRVVAQSGTLPREALSGRRQHFPATNPPTWHKRIKEDNVDFSNGLFTRLRLTAFPPRKGALTLI